MDRLCCLLVMLNFIPPLFSQENINKDSLVNTQIYVTKKFYREVRKLSREIDSLTKHIKLKSNNNLLRITSKIDSLDDEIAEIKLSNQVQFNKPQKKESSCTDWIKAISAVLTAIIAFFWVCKYVNERKTKYKEVETYTIHTLKNLNKSLKNQINSLKEVIGLLSEAKTQNYFLSISSSLLTARNVRNTDRKLLYKTFVHK